MKLPPISLLLVSLLAPVAWADSGTNAATRLPDIVVVDTPIIEGNSVNRHGSQVTTVSQQQIANLNAQDLQSALRETPGVVVSHHNPIGSFGGGEGGAIFIRGMGASRPGAEIMTAINGIPIYNGLWSHPLLDMLSVDIAQRIDVYKGAQPILYGNMAFGVVDLISKRRTKAGYSTSLETAYGSYNTWIETIDHDGKNGHWDYHVGQSYRTSDGNRANSEGELQNYFGQVGYTFNEHWDAHVLVNRTDNWANDPGPSPKLVPPAMVYNSGRFNDDDYLIIATLANHYDEADGYVKPYWNHGTLDWENQYVSGTGLNNKNTLTKYDNYGFKTRETVKPWEGGELMSGVDLDFIGAGYHETTGASVSVFPRETFRIASPYAALSQRVDLDRDLYLLPSAGVRYYSHNVFTDEIAPQAGLAFGISKETTFHASYARGVNYPGIFVKAFPPGNNLADDLRAETVDHYEIGASQKLGKYATLDVNLFQDRGQNRIVTVSPPFPPVWQNLRNFRTEGVESTLTVTPLQNLSLFGGMTVLQANPGDLPYTPEWTASAGVTYRFLTHFKLCVDSQYVGDQTALSRARSAQAINATQLDSYILLNAKLSYDFDCWSGSRGQVFVAGQNLGNASYEQKPGYPMPSINGMAGMRLTF
ncbi:MAG: TonB-dependent receptor [Kiritimatiellia bacterium]